MKLCRWLPVLMALLMIASVGGVQATWNYSQGVVEDVHAYTDPNITLFNYAPEIVLPSQEVGKNYLDLLYSVLNNIKGGLNSSKDTLEKALIKERLLHSSENVQGGNLKHLFITEPCKLLAFSIQYITATEFHLVIYEEAAADSATADEDYITAYRAILRYENGTWDAPEATVGYAIVREFSSEDNWVLPSEWVPGLLPSQLAAS